MSDFSSVARPYAEAAFAVAEADNQIDGWIESLEKISSVFENEKIINLLTTPQISNSEKTKKFVELFDGEVLEKVSSFLNVCGDNNRLQGLPEIISAFMNLAYESMNKKNVSVWSSFELEDTQLTKITEALEKKLNSEVIIDFNIDKSLIGGLKISYDDQVIDMSVKRKLDLLQNQLRN